MMKEEISFKLLMTFQARNGNRSDPKVSEILERQALNQAVQVLKSNFLMFNICQVKSIFSFIQGLKVLYKKGSNVEC